jgi:hypothetical protein
MSVLELDTSQRGQLLTQIPIDLMAEAFEDGDHVRGRS